MMVNIYTFVEEQQGGLPQLDTSTYEEQLSWLFLSFIVFFVVVSRYALPKISSVLEEREEKIAKDLDLAAQKKKEAEDVKTSYEVALAEARSAAQSKALAVKEASASDIAKVKADLDQRLAAEAVSAEKKISDAMADAMSELEIIVNDVAAVMLEKVSGNPVDEKKLATAVKAVVTSNKEA